MTRCRHGLLRRKTRNDCPVSRNTDFFDYNDRSEIVSAQIGANLFAHAYDYIGNQTNHVANTAINTYTHNALNQISTAQEVFAPLRETTHDLDGNMTSDGVYTYAYDAANRLSSVSSNGIVIVANQYDYKGRRIRKTTPTTETTFVYDGWNLVYEQELVGDATNETFYCWGKDLSGRLQDAGGVGGLLYIRRNGTIYIPHADAYGNILRYTDTAGNVVAEYTYDAFGKTIAQSSSMADVFRIRFSTKYFDTETSLYYYGYRFYHPVLMRWLNRDPVEETGGMNLYVFCANNPTLRHDVDGRSWLTCFGDCIEEWRLDWSKIFTAMNAAASLNAPVPKTGTERLWLEKGVSEDTTELSRAISQGEKLARKLPLGNPVRSKIIQSLGNVRRFMRNPALVKAGAAGAALTVFEGFYDIGTMLYCSMHCCGE